LTSLAGTAAIVTGAASGMGRATALLAAQEGATVLCVDLADPQATVAEIERDGGSAVPFEGDVRDARMWAEAVRTVLESGARLQLLANVAGIVPGPGEDTVVDQTEAGWQRIIGVNLTGSWLGMRAVLPVMTEQRRGRIVNVASLAALRGLPMLAAYSASKAGIAGLTRQAAVDYGRLGIRVNAVAPGDIDTPMSRDNPPEVKEALRRRTPANRQGSAEEVAAVIVFLAGPGADFVNGQVLAVDGGWSIKG
jgi:NAD(P)-dependent dehydrogenase (short-subunit alcohol dehydrogenase family)